MTEPDFFLCTTRASDALAVKKEFSILSALETSLGPNP